MSLPTHFEFKSDAFPPEAGEDQETNSGRYGKRLATMLFTQLKAVGFSVLPPMAQDWGWLVELENPTIRCFIGCGAYEEYENGWLVFVEPYQTIKRKWFRKIDVSAMTQPLIKAAYEIVSDHGSTVGLRWWNSEDMTLSKLA
jgi:hypothetical protein